MLRAAVVLILAANLLFFAWARGWLTPVVEPPHHGEREPERLALQVRPETIRLLPPLPAAAGSGAARVVCLEAGPFSDADVGIAEAALLGAGVPAAAWQREQSAQTEAWLVYMGPFADSAALRAKDEEVRRLKLVPEELRTPAELAPGLVLSRHGSKEAAESALAQLTQRGVRTARVLALPPPPLQHWLRVARADARLQERLLDLQPPAFSAPFAPCGPRR
jgi:hypothetical protein